jgi:DNA mismatch repair protein MutH
LEEYFFDYKLNSNSMPDFPKVGLELKSTPVKRTAKGELVAKERLVLMQINYMTVVHETFETSRLVKKASKILLVSYVWEKDSDPLDYKVEMAELWGLPPRGHGAVQDRLGDSRRQDSFRPRGGYFRL